MEKIKVTLRPEDLTVQLTGDETWVLLPPPPAPPAARVEKEDNEDECGG